MLIIVNSTLTTGMRLKQLLHHGLIFGLTSSLQSAFGFVLLPLYTRYLDLEEFGAYNMLLIIAASCNTLFGLGASTALGRYYYEYKKNNKEKDITSSSLWISCLGSILLILLAFLTAHPVSVYYLGDSELQLPYILCLAGNALTYPLTTLTLLLRYKKKSLFYFFVTISGLLLNFGCTLMLLINSDIKICAPFVGMIVSNILLLIILIIYQRKELKFCVPRKEYRLVVVFGLQIILSAFLSYIYECSDKIIMKEILSISDVGIYSLSGRIGTVFKMLVYVPFALIWAPLRMEYKDSPDNVQFIRKITNYYTLLGILLLLGCMVWGYDILKLLFPQEEYALALKIFPLSILGFFFYGYLSIFDFGVFINNKLYYLSIIPVFCLLVNTSLNIWLLPIYGVEASAYIFVLTYVLSAFILLFFSNRFYPIPMDWSRLCGMYVLWIFVFLCFFVVEVPLTHTLWMKVMISFVIVLLTWYVFLTENERKVIVIKVNSFRK